MNKVLNVGGGPVRISPEYEDWECWTLDIDAKYKPNFLMDARDIGHLEPGQFDAVYCSHNLEHYYEHEADAVLAGFYHVLTDTGFVDVRVPDARAVIEAVIQRDLALDSVLYESSVGPIRVCDVLWGYQKEIRESGHDYYAHKTGFSRRLLGQALKRAGFEYIVIGGGGYGLKALAYKVRPESGGINDK